MVDTVSLARVAANDLEISVRVVLRQLFWREPFSQENEAALFRFTRTEIPFSKGARKRRMGSPDPVREGSGNTRSARWRGC